MAFIFQSGPRKMESIGALASAVFVANTIVRFDAGTGFIEPAVGSSAINYGVVLESTTASATDGDTKVLVIPFQDGQRWIADTSGVPTRAMVGTEVDTEGTSASPSQIDEDSGSEDNFYITAIYLDTLSLQKVIVAPNMSALTAIGV
jgi:hypothetical protein